MSRVACAVPPPYVLSPGSNLKCLSRSRDHIHLIMFFTGVHFSDDSSAFQMSIFAAADGRPDAAADDDAADTARLLSRQTSTAK